MHILIVDDQQLVREGLRCLLSTMSGAQVREAGGKAEALSMVRKLKPDVIVVSHSLDAAAAPNLLRRLRNDGLHQRVLVVGAPGDALYAAKALRHEAAGFISKRVSAAEFITAVRKIADGQRYLDRETANLLANSKLSGQYNALEQLSVRQITILKQLAEGQSLKTIAARIGVSYKTIANTCSVMKMKLGVKRTADLIRLGIKLEDH